MKAAEWIDRVKAARGWDSDYRAAQELGLTRSTVSFHRKGNTTLDEEASIKVAHFLGMKPEDVALDQMAERTKDPALRAAIRSLVDRQLLSFA